MTPHLQTSGDLEQAFAYCRRVTRRRARNFYYGLKLAPGPKRNALFVLYAWMRAADDLVDGAERASAESVETFRERTRCALSGQIIDDDPNGLWHAIAVVSEAYDLESKHFDDMLDGQIDDLTHRSYQTFDELSRYCYRVASTVGLLCIRIFGYDDVKAEALAIDRGTAFQLTNIIRDFAEDFDDGRVYLPAEDFKQHGITPRDLRAWANPDACAAFMHAQIVRARSYYERSSELDNLIDADSRPVLWAMSSIYQTLLERIAVDAQRAATGTRIRLSMLKKGMIAVEAQRLVRHSRHASSVSATP